MNTEASHMALLQIYRADLAWLRFRRLDLFKEVPAVAVPPFASLQCSRSLSVPMSSWDCMKPESYITHVVNRSPPPARHTALLYEH